LKTITELIPDTAVNGDGILLRKESLNSDGYNNSFNINKANYYLKKRP